MLENCPRRGKMQVNCEILGNRGEKCHPIGDPNKTMEIVFRWKFTDRVPREL